MSNILIYAIPFGGGPIGKASVIANFLKSYHYVALTSYSNAVSLLKLYNKGVDVIDCKERSIDLLINRLKRGVDIFVSVMDIRVASFVKRAFPKIKVILVDSLLSWRLKEYTTEELVDLDLVDFHVCQFVPDLKKNIVKLKLANNLSKLLITAPIVQMPSINTSNCDENGVLVHFGGLNSPIISWLSYSPFLEKLTGFLIKTYASSNKLLFTGEIDVTNHLQSKFVNSRNVEFRCLSYPKFQEAIRHSRFVLTTPGIETAYESFSNSKPVLFLPPLNSTQLHQLEFFETAGLPNTIPPSFSHYFENISKLNEPYTAKTLHICDLVNELVKEKVFYRFLEKSFDQLVISKQHVRKIVKKQNRFVPKNLKSGLQTIYELVEEKIA